MIATLTLQPLQPGSVDWSTFESLLALADLPAADLKAGGRFFALHDEVGLIGFGGLGDQDLIS